MAVRQPVAADVLPSRLTTDTFALSEIFYSIQGEGTCAGLPCVFVRMQGCKLRCVWCDTPYALDHRTPELEMTADQIVEAVKQYNCSFVEFTGGDPLEQFGVFPLMAQFCDLGYTVAVETGGHVDAALIDERIIRIIDVKCPDSKMSTQIHKQNLENVRATDEYKFVVASRIDFDFAVSKVREFDLCNRAAAVLVSPVWGSVEFLDLATWVLESHLPMRMQLQLHKFIWHPDKRGV